MNYSRRGRFFVDPFFFADLDCDEGVNLFHRMVVLEINHSFLSGRREYVALHHQFRPVATGEITPEYRGIFKVGEIHPTWVEVPAFVGPSITEMIERGEVRAKEWK